jgi:hypothetical protein
MHFFATSIHHHNVQARRRRDSRVDLASALNQPFVNKSAVQAHKHDVTDDLEISSIALACVRPYRTWQLCMLGHDAYGDLEISMGTLGLHFSS